MSQLSQTSCCQGCAFGVVPSDLSSCGVQPLWVLSADQRGPGFCANMVSVLGPQTVRAMWGGSPEQPVSPQLHPPHQGCQGTPPRSEAHRPPWLCRHLHPFRLEVPGNQGVSHLDLRQSLWDWSKVPESGPRAVWDGTNLRMSRGRMSKTVRSHRSPNLLGRWLGSKISDAGEEALSFCYAFAAKAGQALQDGVTPRGGGRGISRAW